MNVLPQGQESTYVLSETDSRRIVPRNSRLNLMIADDPRVTDGPLEDV